MPISDVLNSLFDDELAEGEFRKPKLDGSKLPDYKVVRSYFSTSGMFSCTEPDGWFLMGFSLDKGNAGPVAAGAGALRNPNPIEAEARRRDNKLENKQE